MFVENDFVNETLVELIQNLQQACASKDWEQLGILDEQIKKNLQEIISSAKKTQDKEKLALDIKSIQNIYELVIDGSKKHQLEIAAELKKLTRESNAANSYLGISQF
jgi:hypothetical protein